MSTPSDMSRPRDSADREGGRATTSQPTLEQWGFAVAALVAFLGITYVGPALTRIVRQRRLKERAAARLRDMRRQTPTAKSADQVRRRFPGENG